ncbi:helix-turn-helix domain-containing protein [Ectobacillus sp. JY-23]|uniref:CdaR family transcriptional regulator n=1 Tax=Ectobacillus sp. JY-23 TaxID=2933872 RepID=UPI001FF4B75B|nr:sugar diacid recognition domain-containing protein [Ectobacillus sp. JY-23]UOY94624.1 helix-turn-helix domain-containing protein [Ectobacillus sp. JY-23]
MLVPDLAKKIVREVQRLIPEHIIIIDVNGTIIAGTDPVRIGTFHEGARRCCEQKKTVIITKEDEHELIGVKAGINLPLLFHDEVIGVIGITGEPHDISKYGEILRKMTELLIHENYLAKQLELEQRSYEAFVFDWLQGTWSQSFLDRARTLGIHLQQKRQLILIEVSNDTAQRKLWHHIKNDNEDVLVRWGDNRLILLKSIASHTDVSVYVTRLKTDCESLLSLPIWIGVGQAGGARDMPASYEQAQRALSIALEQNKIIFYENLRLEMCLQDITPQTREQFLYRTIAACDEELLATLRTFIAHNQSYKQTAELLHIHINTLHYRLKKIEEATRLNPKVFEDLVTLYIALNLLDKEPKNKR